ncbi:phage integrase [Leptolyngbya sp. NIES-2104]|nr:phage integrase [Leptolyngbya sp. NIES-2104]
MALGLPDTEINRRIAEAKARQIESDLHTRQFDPSLNKYTDRQLQSTTLSVVTLYERWLEYKIEVEKVYETTLDKYKALFNTVKEFFKKNPVSTLDESGAARFRDYLATKLSDVTLKERIGMMKALWDWASDREYVKGRNPWKVVHESIKVAPTQGEKAFSTTELREIVQAFRTDPQYSYYADFVEFFLSMGCRTGEALALQWKHFNDELTEVWIGESITTKNKRKPTKAHNAAIVNLPLRVSELLKRRRPEDFDPEALVFPGKKGGNLNAKTFYKGAWKTILKKQNIDYRRPYTLRKSFVSNAIYEHGMTIEQVATITRHDPKVLKDSYLESVGMIATPDILAD